MEQQTQHTTYSEQPSEDPIKALRAYQESARSPHQVNTLSSKPSASSAQELSKQITDMPAHSESKTPYVAAHGHMWHKCSSILDPRLQHIESSRLHQINPQPAHETQSYLDHLFDPMWRVPQKGRIYYSHLIAARALKLGSTALNLMKWLCFIGLITAPIGLWLRERRLPQRMIALSSKYLAIASMYKMSQQHLDKEGFKRSILSILSRAAIELEDTEAISQLWQRLTHEGSIAGAVKLMGDVKRLEKRLLTIHGNMRLQRVMQLAASKENPSSYFNQLSARQHRHLAQQVYEKLHLRLELAYLLLKVSSQGRVRSHISRWGYSTEFILLEKYDLRDDKPDLLSQYDILDFQSMKYIWRYKHQPNPAQETTGSSSGITIHQLYKLSTQELSKLLEEGIPKDS